MTVVTVDHLCKSYAGKVAVDDLSFSVGAGEILGIIGPNGAGKSSTIKTILDFMKPDSGSVTVFGGPINEEAKNRIGYLPEERGLYGKLTAIELILYLASLKGMRKDDAEKRADELLRRTGMFDSRNKKIKAMSKGMGQMIQFIVTVIHDPQLLILDEPFSGLDPVNADIMKVLVGEMRDEGKAIILSTHQMSQVEELGDRVLMINHGRAVLYGDLDETRSRFRKNSVHVAIEGELGALEGVAQRKPNKNGFELFLRPETTPQMILDQLRDQGETVHRFEVATPSLHEIFVEMAGKER